MTKYSRAGSDPAALGQFGFTRLELVAVLAAVALFLSVISPVWSGNRARSARAVCFNNLRQIGLAMQLWGADHQDRPPQEVPVSEGGTMQHELTANVWLHFSWISNELKYAQALFCPSDQGRPARDFSSEAATGYAHPNFRNSATSYFLSHSGSALGGYDVLAGDGNLGVDGLGTCNRFTQANSVRVQLPSPNFRWGTNMHGSTGHFLYFDGHVVELSDQSLEQESKVFKGAQTVLHFINHR